MISLTRREFLKLSLASGPLLFAQGMPAASRSGQVRFGVCADPHQDIMHDAEDRLRQFILVAKQERLDFIIQLGDFCRPYSRNKGFLAIWDEFSGPRYHTLGNHDNDGGFEWAYVQEFLNMPRRYYSFESGAWHFIVLDGNEIRPGKRAPGYPRYMGEEQQGWLRDDLEKTTKRTIVFSHQSLEDPDGIENNLEVRRILEEANRAAGWRKVGACFSGHHHIDFATQIAGIHYVQVNSMSYSWLGEKFQHDRYDAEVNKAHPWIKFTAPYREGLYAVVTLSTEDGLRITGRRSEFVGPSPWDLGMEEVKGSSRDKTRLVPWIADRQLPWLAGA